MHELNKFLWLFMFAAALASGCAKRYIPNTEIEDTEENRAIVDFCEQYRKAVSEMNIGLLVSMASPRYFDNSGSIKGDDDMDRNGLEESLRKQFKQVKSIRHEIRYRDIFEKDSLIYVEYYYTTAFQYVISGEERWSNKTADNRLELERVDGGYLIVSGM